MKTTLTGQLTQKAESTSEPSAFNPYQEVHPSVNCKEASRSLHFDSRHLRERGASLFPPALSFARVCSYLADLAMSRCILARASYSFAVVSKFDAIRSQ